MENYQNTVRSNAIRKIPVSAIGVFFCIIFFGSIAWWFSFPPVSEARRFTVPRGMPQEDIVGRLREDGYIKGTRMFNFFRSLRGRSEIVAGGYMIPEGTNAWELAGILTRPPQMVWVTVPEGLRREEIAEIFSDDLQWDEEDMKSFFDAPRLLGYPVEEGIYFPDTYLIDQEENGGKVAQRMINRFQEQLALYQADLTRENIKWDTALKIASLVQREAGGESDMPIIAAVIWNRLLAGMKLDIDATLQYAIATKKISYGLSRASIEWWEPLNREAKNIDSGYNTYKAKGLPPGPIANPGRAALQAAIHPAKSRCLYYLHDTERAIHCAATYEEHQNNIERYLR